MTTKGYRGSAAQWALLAALLAADGDVVRYDDLGDLIGAYGVNVQKVVRQHALRLRARGFLCIEIVPRRGCRLRALPPDAVLEDVLAMLDVIRRDGYAVPAIWRRTA